MPKRESEQISLADGEVLEKVAIVTPAKSPAKKSKKGILRSVGAKSISPGVKPTAKRSSVLREDKYAPGDTSFVSPSVLLPAKSTMHPHPV